MSKKKLDDVEVTVITTDAALESEKVISKPKTFSKRAYGLLEKDDKFHLICVSYNPDTMEAGKVTILKSDPDQFNMEYEFENATENMIYD